MIIHQFIDARHYGLALEGIARTLAHQTIAITGQERADMFALANRVDMLAPGRIARRGQTISCGPS